MRWLAYTIWPVLALSALLTFVLFVMFGVLINGEGKWPPTGTD